MSEFDGDKDYEHFTAHRVTPYMGAELDGIDLTRPLTSGQAEELQDALARFQVIFFRDQEISHDAHKALGLLFGPLAIHSAVAGIEGHPEIVAIHADANSKYVAGESWHSDLSADEAPPLGSILYLHTVPPTGGDTMFSCMYKAYDALSDRMKAYLAGLEAVHDANPVYHALFKDYDKRYPVATHPVIRKHPVTGKKCLFVNSSYTTRIEGLSDEESRLGLLPPGPVRLSGHHFRGEACRSLTSAMPVLRTGQAEASKTGHRATISPCSYTAISPNCRNTASL